MSSELRPAANPARDPHVAVDRAPRPPGGGGRASTATTPARSPARSPRRRGGAGRAGGSARCGPRIAWPIRAWGIARRPAPSSTSSPAATATSVASRSSIALQSAGRPEDGQRGRRPGDGDQVEDPADDRVEAVEAQADHGPDRLRQIAADGAVGVADQLGDEEGVAAGGGTQLGRPRRVAPADPQQLGDARRSARRPTAHAREQPVAGEPGGDPVELGRRIVGGHRTVAHDHHPTGQLVAEDVLDHLQRRRVGPLQVVEDDQQRVADDSACSSSATVSNSR